MSSETIELVDLKNLFRLDGKVALVTGGGGILGKHFCSGLAQYGASVCVTDLNLDAAKETSELIQKHLKIETFPFELDVSDESSVEDVLNRVKYQFGRLDILHNNAATKSKSLEKFFASVDKYDIDTWDEIMKVNVTGMFTMARGAARIMLKQEKGGSIIQTSSIYGILAPDQRIYEGSQYMGMEINTPAIYSASKAAVIGLTRYLSTYWAEKIRVNSLTPGGVSSGQNSLFAEKYSNRVPMGRMAQADDLVGALIYLSSDASAYMTGQNLVVDGGLSAW